MRPGRDQDQDHGRERGEDRTKAERHERAVLLIEPPEEDARWERLDPDREVEPTEGESLVRIADELGHQLFLRRFGQRTKEPIEQKDDPDLPSRTDQCEGDVDRGIDRPPAQDQPPRPETIGRGWGRTRSIVTS